MNKYEIYNLESGYLINIEDEVTVYDFYDVPKQIIDIIKQFEQENKELHNKIDKAIEYINKNSIYFATSEKVGNYFSNCNCDDLLEILKDSDVDE